MSVSIPVAITCMAISVATIALLFLLGLSLCIALHQSDKDQKGREAIKTAIEEKAHNDGNRNLNATELAILQRMGMESTVKTVGSENNVVTTEDIGFKTEVIKST